MLRYERQTVAMELAAALHHSAGPVTNEAVRSQKTVSSRGARPGVLQEPEPQLLDAALARRTAGEPSVATPLLAAPAAESVDSATLRFLTPSALTARRKEETEKQMKVMAEEREPRRLRQTIKKEFLELCDVGSHRSSLQTRRMQEVADILDSTEQPAGIYLGVLCWNEEEEEEEEEEAVAEVMRQFSRLLTLAWVFYVLVDSDPEVNFPTLGDDFRNCLRILWLWFGFAVDPCSCVSLRCTPYIGQSLRDCLARGEEYRKIDLAGDVFSCSRYSHVEIWPLLFALPGV